MAEEYQVCSGNWWNSPRNLFGSLPCSWAVNDSGWPSNCDEPAPDVNNNTVMSSDDSAGSASDRSCTTLHDVPKTDQLRRTSTGSLSSTDCWNQDFTHENGRSEEHYSQIMNFRQENNWNINSKNFCEDFSGNSFEQVQRQSSNSGATTYDEIPVNFPLDSSLMKNLLSQENPQPNMLSSYLDDKEMNYFSESNYVMNPNEVLLSSLPESSPMLIKTSRQQTANHPQFINNNSFWNVNTASALKHDPSNFIPSTNSPILPSFHNNITYSIPNFSFGNNLEAVEKKQNSGELALKRARIETPSPLPTFKVRKEKLGDRITALQQLVSPFGKTDTASVLHEAIEYIKFLHDQVKVLGTPYMKNGSPPCPQHQLAGIKPKYYEGLNQDLKSRGLCLVPISSTFPVASETTSDFWTQTFGVNFM